VGTGPSFVASTATYRELGMPIFLKNAEGLERDIESK
jgi:hypothetical protein